MSDANLMAESYAEEATNNTTLDNMHNISDEDNKPCCNFCGKKFAQSSYIKAHMRLHTGEKPFACTFCPKRFSDCSNWKKHERIHIRQLGLSADKAQHLSKHSVYLMQNNFPSPKLKMADPPPVSGGPSSEYVCKICGKSFANASSLTTHKRIHSGERPYQCQTCGKSFTQIGTLRTHERVHTGEKPYVCKICGQTFAQSGSFRMHERRHMMEMLHKCPICPVKFQQWEDAKQHLATHPEIVAQHPEITEGNSLLESLFNSEQQVSTSQSSSSAPDDLLPSIDSVSSRPDPLSAPTFPFPTQMPPLMSAALHFPGAFSMASMAADLASPLNVFAPHMLRTDALGLPLRQLSSELTPPPSASVISLPTVTSVIDLQESSDAGIVSTTTSMATRERQDSVGSHGSRSGSTPEGTNENNTHNYHSVKEELEKEGNSCMMVTMNMNGDVNNKTISEDSSITSDHSDVNGNDTEMMAIRSQNLHSRMISSSNSRKQRHPTRRYSSNSVMAADTSTQASSHNNGFLDTSSIVSDATTLQEDDDLCEEFTSVSGKFYRCEHCHILFEDCTLYLLHNGFHSHDSDPFKCVICRASCRDRIEFNCHLTSHIK